MTALWVVKIDIKTIAEQSGVSDDAVTHWVNFCREVCYLLYLDDPPKIGGKGKQVVADRRARTLIAVIKKYVLPGTTIISDGFRSYYKLDQEGFDHLVVNHKLHFKDPETGEHTNNIEATWGAAKKLHVGKRKTCPHCGRDMELKSYTNTDHVVWRCRSTSKKIGVHSIRTSVRCGTWFEKSTLKLHQIITMTALWVVKIDIKTIAEQSGVSDDAVTHWVNFCREVCYLLYLDDPPKIGGKGKQVQIDESLFGHNKKTKNHSVPKLPKDIGDMELKSYTNTDHVVWRCRSTSKKIGVHSIRTSLRCGTWFEKSTLKLHQIITMTALWVVKIDIKTIAEQSGVSDDAVTHWVNFCREVCYLLYLDDPPKIGDHVVWRCRSTSKKIGVHSIRTSLRCGTWFEKSTLKLHQIITMTALWVVKIDIKTIAEQSGVSDDAVTHWVNFCREVCYLLYLDDPPKIGGKGKQVLPGTTIISDGFRSYYKLDQEGFDHLVVNHKLHFKDPETGAHTNNIEATWGAAKKLHVGKRKVKDSLEFYLSEYWWRRSIMWRTCPHCGRDMELKSYTNTDHVVWRCRSTSKKIGVHSIRTSLRCGTWFEKSTLKLHQIITMTALWVVKIDIKTIAEQSGVSDDAVTHWVNFCREVCYLLYLDDPPKIGSKGKQVQIDESLFGHNKKTKNHYAKTAEGHWIDIKTIAEQSGVSDDAVTHWVNFCREVCYLLYLDDPPKIGSKGKQVQIDESLFGHNKKTKNHCAKTAEGHWIDIKTIAEQSGVSDDAVTHWVNFCREVCYLLYLDDPPKIGSKGKQVQIDESLFGHNKKTKNHCAKTAEGHWIDIKTIAEQSGVSDDAVTHWVNFCREVCYLLYLDDPPKIGGKGKQVQIDESLFGHNKKTKNHCAKTAEGHWIDIKTIAEQSGVSDDAVTHWVNFCREVCYLLYLDDPPKIGGKGKQVLPGTTIISDGFRSYYKLDQEGFDHLVVNHKLHFKDPETGAHTNNIEATWGAAKKLHVGKRKVKDSLEFYLSEYWWRRSIMWRTCPHCGRDMELKSYTNTDHVVWRCRSTSKKIGVHSIRTSLRCGTWFEKSTLKLHQIITMTALWVVKIDIKTIAEQSGVSDDAVTHWVNFCREVCYLLYLDDPPKIGGKGKQVQIDESLFGHNKKTKNHCAKTAEGHWVFGGVDVETKVFFFQVVADRRARTLIAVIKKYVLPGTTIISDGFRSYYKLDQEGFDHLVVNHKLHFKDPETGAHTNNIEATWGAAKKLHVGKRKVKDSLEFYLSEYWWRRKHYIDIKTIAEQSGVSDDAVTHWVNFCREVCYLLYLDDPPKIGGKGKQVQIDESLFGHNKKTKNHCAKTAEGHWVFGGVDVETKVFFFQVVADRRARTLIAVIKKYVLPGTTIISKWGFDPTTSWIKKVSTTLWLTTNYILKTRKRDSPIEQIALQKIDLDPEQQLYTTKIVDIAAAVMEIIPTQDSGHCCCCDGDAWRHLRLFIGHNNNNNTVYTPKIVDIAAAVMEIRYDDCCFLCHKDVKIQGTKFQDSEGILGKTCQIHVSSNKIASRYSGVNPGGALNLRNRQHQTTLTRFRTGHFKPLKIENNNKIYLTCPKYSLAPAAPEHILVCIRCTKQDL
ncbi:hypothetical protein LAZ67_6001228 [Cordylochernes scorpioides]|uniref:ISXO2-like transposase domain-containing protein n=1 Tax=Cordylochernes scorpioides TaxID=51811 RepID=A0ABY6KMR2_9ARAC|nr:hypothetical protein LAZ67_6001228 [Cordylochernes scorpioides]